MTSQIKTTTLHLSILIFLFVGVFGFTQDWDYITFSQGWPQTRCIEQNVTHDHRHKCAIPNNVNSWIIHGVWPSFKGSSIGPEHCNESYPFNPNEIQDLLAQMKILWPNLFVKSKQDSFWEHEWVTHGTCAMTEAAMSDEHKYFSKGLQLGSKYNILKLLTKKGIVPRNNQPYKLANILAVIKDQLGVSVRAECLWNPDNQKLYLGEIHICLSKKFTLIDCQSDGYLRFEPCSRNKKIFYPVIVH